MERVALLHDGVVDESFPFDNWMGMLNTSARNKPFHKLKLGTHDSAAYHLDFKPLLTLDNNKTFRLLTTLAQRSHFVAEIVRRWTITQQYSIYDQLRHGVRWFDFRVSFDKQTNQNYLSHRFACLPLLDALNQIESFLSNPKYSSEVVVLYVVADYEHRHSMSSDRWHSVYEEIRRVLGHLMGEFGSSSVCNLSESCTLDQLIASNTRVLLYSGGSMKNPSLPIWDSKQYVKVWHNTSDTETKVHKLQATLDRYNATDSCMLTNADLVLTPQLADVVDDIVRRATCRRGSSLKTYAADMEQKLVHVLQQDLSGVSILSTDFPSKQFVRNVILLNSS